MYSRTADVLEAEGYCYGRIAEECRGESGFGYDPIHLHRRRLRGQDVGEATAEEKDALLEQYHPDYNLSSFAEIIVGPNKGEKAPKE